MIWQKPLSEDLVDLCYIPVTTCHTALHNNWNDRPRRPHDELSAHGHSAERTFAALFIQGPKTERKLRHERGGDHSLSCKEGEMKSSHSLRVIIVQHCGIGLRARRALLPDMVLFTPLFDPQGLRLISLTPDCKDLEYGQLSWLMFLMATAPPLYLLES